MDVGCYCVSAARLLCGEPVRAHAEHVLGGEDVDVVFAGVLGFDAGVVAHIDCALVVSPRDELVVLGERGSIRLADPWHCRRPVIELERGGAPEAIAVPAANSYGLELENLSAAIRGTAAPLLGREDAIGQARAIEALYSSAQEHRTVTLSGA
jgi:D-xylose 1-dehydrogenase (NADP+, D-xylono-1,5-lactone-forming)